MIFFVINHYNYSDYNDDELTANKACACVYLFSKDLCSSIYTVPHILTSPFCSCEILVWVAYGHKITRRRVKPAVSPTLLLGPSLLNFLGQC